MVLHTASALTVAATVARARALRREHDLGKRQGRAVGALAVALAAAGDHDCADDRRCRHSDAADDSKKISCHLCHASPSG